MTPDVHCLITPVRPPAYVLQMEIALLHKTGPLLIYSRGRLPNYTTPCSFTPDGDYPLHHALLIYPRWRLPYYTTPAHLPHMEITLLHHPCSFTPDGDYPLHHALLIYPRWRLLYDTTPCSCTPHGDDHTMPSQLIYPRWRLPYYTTPAHLPQMEITLLHHPCSFTTDGDYPATTDRPPANQPKMDINLLHHTGSLLIYPRWRLPYSFWSSLSIVVTFQLTIFMQLKH